MKKKWERKGLAVALTVGLALSSMNFACAAAEEPVFDLDQVVVTATKTEKKVKDVPAAVEVITKEEMDRKNIKRVADALTNIPGVFVRQTKGVMGTTDSITMRGFGDQKQVLVLVDGLPMNDGYSGGVNFANIPTENIDRIEVIKGPASALYGSNALGGVINIITKDKAKQETTVRLSNGGMGTNSQSVYTSGSTGKIDYFITAQKTSTDGYESNDQYKTDSSKTRYGNNGMKRDLYDAKLVFHLDENSKLSLSGGSNDFKYFYDIAADRGEKNEDIWTLNYENKLTDTSSMKVSYGEKKLDSWYVMGKTYTVTPSQTSQAELQYNCKLGATDLLTVGYTYRTEQADTKDNTLKNAWDLTSVTAKAEKKTGGKTETNSIFFQNEHKLGENSTLYLGGRYDNWRFYDGYNCLWNTASSSYVTSRTADGSANSFNPKIGLVQKINDKLTMRSSIGKAFRAPDIYALAKNWESSSGSIYRCNPNLVPEKSTNYEMGFDYQVDKSLLTRINIYHTDVTDAIDQKKSTENISGVDRTVYKYINSGKSRINGLELSMNKRIDDAWSSFINYTYTDAKVTKSTAAPENVGKQVGGVPKEMFNVGVNYAKDRWQGSIIGNYVSSANGPDKAGKTGYGTDESRFTVDTKVTYKMTKDATVSLSIDNLLDRKYYVSYLAAPRTTYLELTYKF